MGRRKPAAAPKPLPGPSYFFTISPVTLFMR